MSTLGPAGNDSVLPTEKLATLSLTFSSNSNETTTIPTIPAVSLQSTASASHVTTYVVVPIGSIILILLIAALIIFLVRKSRLDKLRHHLMPLYNFDPAEEGEDWESELLEEGMDHRIAPRMKMRVETPSPIDEPKLTFNRDSGL